MCYFKSGNNCSAGEFITSPCNAQMGFEENLQDVLVSLASHHRGCADRIRLRLLSFPDFIILSKFLQVDFEFKV